MMFLRACLYLLLISTVTLSAPVEYSFLQQSDHFSPSDQSTFIQYYWVNQDYYRDGGPALVYLTNFARPLVDLQSSAISSWGESLGAVLIELEVRYSGQSRPTTNFTSSSFVYQSPQQNLADIISFHSTFIATFPKFEDAPWILIGEYYNANYAIWAREKNPNVVRGAVAIAGPVLAERNYPNYFQYWAKVAGDECASIIHTANEETEVYLDSNPDQAAQLKQLFSCEDVEDDTQFFYVLGQVVQFGIANYRAEFCAGMLSYTPESLIEQYGSGISQLLVASGTQCSDWNIAGDTDPSNTYRPTFYLSCGYLGQFETAGPTTPTTIVSARLDVLWYLSICEEVFGTYLFPDTDQTNTVYGGLEVWGTNYAFISSTSDPFSALGVNQTSLHQSQAIRVTTLHSIFEFLSGVNTTEPIQSARFEVLQLMETWVGSTSSSTVTYSPTPTQSLASDNNNTNSNWEIYVFITVGVLCTIFLAAIVGFAVLQFTQQKLNESRLPD